MIYRFKSKASADLIMMESIANTVLRALGKPPTRQGLIQLTELSSAILSL